MHNQVCFKPWSELSLIQHCGAFTCCLAGYNSLANPSCLSPEITQDDLSKPGIITKLWNSQNYQDIRKLMINNEITACCKSTSLDKMQEFRCSGRSTYNHWTSRAATTVQKSNLLKAQTSMISQEVIVDHFPVCLEIYLDDACNLNCPFCCQRQGTKIGKLDISHLQAELLEYLQNSIEIGVIGGEPTVCEYYDTLMQLISQTGERKTKIVTNGHLIKDKIIPYIECFKEIQISIDASNAEIYNQVRPSNNPHCNWLNLIDNIEYITKKYPNLDIGLVFLISGYNYKDMPNMIDLANHYGIRRIFLYEVFNIPYANANSETQKTLHFTHTHPEVWRSYAESAIAKIKDYNMNAIYLLQSLGISKSVM